MNPPRKEVEKYNCPACGARPGSSCVTLKRFVRSRSGPGLKTQPHLARKNAWRSFNGFPVEP